LPYFWSSRVKEDDPVVAVVVDMVSVDMVAIFVRVVTKNASIDGRCNNSNVLSSSCLKQTVRIFVGGAGQARGAQKEIENDKMRR
jgi:hypothetical protein